MVFQVRAITSSKYGPFSDSEKVTIKPKAPTFTVSTKPSCINRPTGEITLSEVSGIDPFNSYNCTIIKTGEAASSRFKFTGSGYTINNEFENGSYRVDLYYNDESITGCSVAQFINVGANPELTYSFTTKDASCPESSDGEITAEINSSFGDYQFKINERTFINSEGTFDSLPNGSYTLEITDYCYTDPLKEVILIDEPAVVTIGSIVKKDPTCLSSPNGSISINTTGGNDTCDFQIINDQGNIVSSANGQGQSWSYNYLPGGNYTIKARSEGCEWKKSNQVLAAVQPISFSATTTDVECFGKNTGRVSLTASGGKPAYLYSIDNQPCSVILSLNLYMKVHTF